MSKRRDPSPEFDLFIPALGDLSLRDQREVMERPFFSLQKRKRLKPIEYRSPDGELAKRAVHVLGDMDQNRLLAGMTATPGRCCRCRHVG